MTDTLIPTIVEAKDLAKILHHEHLVVVDLGKQEHYQQHHIPGAVHLDPDQLRRGKGSQAGLLPAWADLETVLDRLGIGTDTHVVAYDHENGAEACRLLWVLDCVSHSTWSLLNGGMTAWLDCGLDVEYQTVARTPASFVPSPNEQVIADKEYTRMALHNPGIQILDARSPEEYRGEKSASDRKGRIPGSINLNWLDTIDVENSRRLKSSPELEMLVEKAGLDRENEIIVHCQTHRRSSHSYVMLKSLEFPRVRGYAGSWAEWSEDESLPIETG